MSILAGALAGCWRHPQSVDPMAAIKRPDVGYPVLHLRWKKIIVDNRSEYGTQEFASPAVSGDRVFVGSRGGWLFALRRTDGAILWKKKIGAVSARPLIDRGDMYIGTDDGVMLCLDTFDGEERWRYATRGAVLRTPVLSDDLLLFSNDEDHVYALDRAKGTFRWQFKADTPEDYTLRGHAGVSVIGDLVFTGFANGSVVALRKASGSVAWMTSITGGNTQFVDVDSLPSAVDDVLYVASAGGGVYALDTATGLVRWRMDIAGAGSVVPDEGRLYFAAADTGVFAADLGGNVFWRQGIRGGGEPADPVVTGDYLVYALSDDGVFVADKHTGVVYQYFDPGYGVSAVPTVAADDLYVLSNGGVLYALDIDRFN